MSLARRILNGEAMEAICVPEEMAEVKTVLHGTTVKLRRTFNQGDGKGGFIKFWRVVGPANHPLHESDISVDGMQRWGIL